MSNLAILGWGRMNPPTIGHEKLVDLLASLADRTGGDALLYLSHSQDRDKNPLPYESKIKWAELAFGDRVNVIESDAKTIIQVLAELNQNGYDDLIYVGGSDRIGGENDITANLLRYNGVADRKGNIPYTFNSMEFVSAGDRDGDSDDATSRASASLARKFVKEDDFENFSQIVPFDEGEARKLFDELRGNLDESLEDIEYDQQDISEDVILGNPGDIDIYACNEFIDYINAVDAASKKELMARCIRDFGLEKEGRSIYGTKDFSVRFTSNKSFYSLENSTGSQDKPGTVIGIKRIMDRKVKPFFVVCTYPQISRSRIWLANITFIKGVSHTSGKHFYFNTNDPDLTNFSGSIQGSDLLSEPLTSKNFEDLWSKHLASSEEDNLTRISQYNQERNNTLISKNAAKRYNASENFEENLSKNIHNSIDYCNSNNYKYLLNLLNTGAQVAASYMPRIVDYDNNTRSNIVEAIIKDPTHAEAYIENPSIIGNEHGLADFILDDAYVDIKFGLTDSSESIFDDGHRLKEKISVGGGGSKLISIEAMMQTIDNQPEKIILFYVFKSSRSGNTFSTALLSVYDSDNISRYGVTDLWSGAGSRGHIGGALKVHKNSIDYDLAYTEFLDLFENS